MLYVALTRTNWNGLPILCFFHQDNLITEIKDYLTVVTY